MIPHRNRLKSCKRGVSGPSLKKTGFLGWVTTFFGGTTPHGPGREEEVIRAITLRPEEGGNVLEGAPMHPRETDLA